MDNFIELLANFFHVIWAGWMRYLFTRGHFNDDGSFTIEAPLVERWVRQMNTDYENLPESEKELDREEALKIIKIISEDTRIRDIFRVLVTRLKNSLLTFYRT